MKPRCSLLLTGSLLLIALVFLVLAFLTGGTVELQEKFELPDAPETAGVKRSEVKSADLAAGNLFHPQRGAAVPAEQEKAAARPSARLPAAGKFELTGIFSFGDARGAIITGAEELQTAGKMPVKPKPLYREGDPVGSGYVVQKIEKDRAILSRENEKTVLLLHKKEKKL